MGVKEKAVLVGMSGGVRSAVTAALLKSQGYEVHALHIVLADPSAPEAAFGARCARRCTPDEVRAISEKAGLPFHVADARDLYRDRVIDYFVHECLQNRLPNPCIPCNHDVKFRVLAAKADALGIRMIATGHSACVVHDVATGDPRLQKSSDRRGDQSYYLFGLDQGLLRRLLLPLGGLQEAMVAKLAAEFGMSPASEPARCDACYVDDPAARDYIDQNSPSSLRAKGMIRSSQGVIIGEHEGLHRYSIGQSEGLDITIKDRTPLYVIGFDLPRQALIVGAERELYQESLTATSARWVRAPDGMRGLRCKARVHPHQEEADCRVTLFENGTVRVRFDRPQRAIVPGQAIVFYDGDDVMGGAVIDQVGEGEPRR